MYIEEIWKDIPEYEGLYQISNLGYVKSIKSIKSIIEISYLNPWFDKNGYQKVTLSKDGIRKQFYIHRLVAQAFISNINNDRDVRFIDGNKCNVIFTNLEWCTISHISKKHKKGASSLYAKLTENQIKEIRSIFIKGDREFGCNSLAKKYGVSKSTMSYILNGKTYK